MALDTRIDLLIPRSVELLGGEFLRYDSGLPIQKAAPPKVFNDFADHLDPNDNKAILKFAKSWGVMGVCEEHGLPVSHALIPGGSTLGLKACWPSRVKGTEYLVEPLDFWRRIITKTSAIRRVAADIASGGKGNKEHWHQIESYVVAGQEPWKSRSAAINMLSTAIQDWIYIGGVRPRFFWNETDARWKLVHAAPGGALWPLFSWLAIQLAIEVGGGRGVVVVCPYCKDVYFPERLPTPGKRHSCKNAPCRQAYFRDYRRSKREERR